VLKVISRSAFDLPAVLDTLVESAARLCQADKASIMRPEGETFRFSASFGFDDDFKQINETLPIGTGRGTLAGRVMLDRQTVHIPDVLSDPDYGRADLQHVGAYRSMLGVPLLREGVPIGVIILLRSAFRPFTDKQMDVVQTFADQAVIAIENARLFEEVQARTAELSEALEQQTATSQVLEVISSSPGELGPVFDAMLTNATRICEAEYGMMFRFENGQFHPTALLNVPAALVEHVRQRGSFLPASETPLDRLLRSRSVINSLDVTLERNPGVAAEVGGARSLVGVPMLKESELIGAIVIYRRDVRPFTEKQVELVTSFARQAVIAIENVRLLNELRFRTNELGHSLENLQKAQDRLIQSEKLASLGQLTAGIAHEIKNPLNFVNNFSSLSAELLDELREMLEPAALDKKTSAAALELMDMLKGNLEKVVQHGKRADSIVKNMLLHSREGSGERRFTDVNAIVEESMNLAYHGARAEKPGFNITLEKDLDPAAGEADLYAQEVTRVLLNLFSNGFYAAAKRKAETDGTFEPTIRAATRNLGDRVEIRIRDNGTGISEEVAAKMFNPFFTTKPAGEGTGLGLSLSHDIIAKQHGGTIDVATAPSDFTEFIITLPRSGAPNARTKPS
jgi:signal transduction histidine kinase